MNCKKSNPVCRCYWEHLHERNLTMICYELLDMKTMTNNLPPLSDDVLNFQLPSELEATEPAEARGMTRDQVKLMVSYCSDNKVTHTKFCNIGDFLSPGDVLVINTSSTINASIPASLSNGTSIELHLCTRLPSDLWIVEVAEPGGYFTISFPKVTSGEVITLPNGGSVTLHVPYLPEQRSPSTKLGSVRLWIATFSLPLNLFDYLEQFATPIRYSYVKHNWPIQTYRTVYACEPGSAELPSAGRPFTPELITQLVSHGILITPLILHTGVASIRNDEPLYEEYYKIPLDTARTINNANLLGKRVVAVGTTVVRALETVVDSAGEIHPGEGWTRILITPSHKIRSVNGLLTGMHTARSSHMFMITAFAGPEHIKLTYKEAIANQYLWHEFGDTHLILK